MPGGTNLPVLRGLGCGSQTPYPYDAYLPEFIRSPNARFLFPVRALGNVFAAKYRDHLGKRSAKYVPLSGWRARRDRCSAAGARRVGRAR